MPKNLLVEASTVINQPRSNVFNYVKFAMNQNEFSIWNMKDPDQKVATSGVDGTIGFIYSWDSKDKGVGAGSQEITNLIENEEVHFQLRFERPMKNIANARFVLRKLSNEQTEVTWKFEGPTKFPMSLFRKMFQKMLYKDMAKSMENLKAKLD